MKNQRKQPHTQESGFVILFSILVSTAILIMSAGIFRVAQKEAVFSSFSRNSQLAFYAADSGLECALYWDISTLVGSTTFPITQEPETHTDDFICGTDEEGNSIGIEAYKFPYGKIYEHVFGFRYVDYTQGAESLGCAFVFVEKKEPEPPAPGQPLNPIETRITSVGYNVCEDNLPDLSDPSLLERRVSVFYERSQ